MAIKIAEAERRVRAKLGPDYGVTKIDRYWLVGKPNREGGATSAWSKGPWKHTNLDKAIEEARVFGS